MNSDSTFLENLKSEANRITTLNGAATLASTGKHCLDFFASIGSSRNIQDKEIIKNFYMAFVENKDLAMKTLFYGRDIRGGLGERRVFRVIIQALADLSKDSLIKNLKNIPEYGRYDDLLPLLETDVKKEIVSLISEQLKNDLENIESDSISLLAKWLPSINAHNAQAIKYGKILAKELNISEKQYRQTLSKLRARIKIIENNLREKDYTFEYSKVPSKAMFKYNKAFIRNDKERYMNFMEKVQKGDAKLHTDTLYPYEIVRPIVNREKLSEEQRTAINVTWENQTDYTNGKNAIIVVDGSGSMYWHSMPSPAMVAQSLAVYFAERNTGVFRNHFITFSQNPQLIEIKGQNIYEKITYCMSFNECANTNIQKVFELILNTAVKHNAKQKELPETIYIISDMEFDTCTDNASLTNFEYAKKLFESNGYKLPKIIFWNVNALSRQFPIRNNEQGVALVSGCSPKTFDMVMSDEIVTPYQFMLSILNSERYASIAA